MVEPKKITYGVKQLREAFSDHFHGWGDGDYQFPLIGAIFVLFVARAKELIGKISLTDIRFDRVRSESSVPHRRYFLCVVMGRIIDVELDTYEVMPRPLDFPACFVRGVIFSGPEMETEILFCLFKHSAKTLSFGEIKATAKELLKKERLACLDGGTKSFFEL